MTERTRLGRGSSNWETIVFLVLNDFLGSDNRVFQRSQFLSAENVDSMAKWAQRLGHKKKPTTPLETLQSTIQTMRKKGYIDFQQRGEWKLTKKGLDKMFETVKNYQKDIDGLDTPLKSLE